MRAKCRAQRLTPALAELESIATEVGVAVGIGQAFPVTIERVREWATTLNGKGIVLAPVSACAQSSGGSVTLRTDRPDQTLYRLCAGAMLISRSGQVWVGQRIDTPGAWQMPQGGIDTGGDGRRRPPCANYARKLVTSRSSCLPRPDGWLIYDLPPALAARSWGREVSWPGAEMGSPSGCSVATTKSTLVAS